MTRLILLATLALAACGMQPPLPSNTELKAEVEATERAFARTMADRDHAAFASFLADEAVFYSPSPTHGRQAIADQWKRFYEKPAAPFSWKPESVEVLASGGLAISSGPVYDPAGKQTGTFTSIWRREAPGVWRIIFDKGGEVCEPPAH